MLLNITCHLHLRIVSLTLQSARRQQWRVIRESHNLLRQVLVTVLYVPILPVVRHKMYYNAGYKDASYKMR